MQQSPQPYTTSPQPVAVQTAPKVFTNEFKEQWTDWCKEGDTCLLSCFCPCVLYSQNTERINGSNPACSCLIYTGCFYFLGNIGSCILGGMSRNALRLKYGINAGDCSDDTSDWLIHCCCFPCALSQEHRELKWRADQPILVTIPGMPAQTVHAQPVYATQPGQPVYGQPVAYAPGGIPQQQQVYQQQSQPVMYGQPQQGYYDPNQQPPQYAQQGYPQQQQQYPAQAYPQQGYPQQQPMYVQQPGAQYPGNMTR